MDSNEKRSKNSAASLDRNEKTTAGRIQKSRPRTAALKEQNTAAQRRYRERQKLRACENEKLKLQLSERVLQLETHLRHTVQEKAALQERVKLLEERIASLTEKGNSEDGNQIAGVNTFRMMSTGRAAPEATQMTDGSPAIPILQSSTASLFTSDSPPLNYNIAASDTSAHQRCKSSHRHIVQPKDHSLSADTQLFQTKWVSIFTTLLNSAGSENRGKINLKDLCKDIQDLSELIFESSMFGILKLGVQQTLFRYTGFASDVERLHWTHVTEKLSLQSPQINSLLVLRNSLISLLEQLLSERYTCCVKLRNIFTSLQQTLASLGECNKGSVNGVQQLSEWVEKTKYEGLSCLEGIASSSQREHQALVEFNMLAVHRVLHPSQVVRFMVDSHPLHAHALYVAHVLQACEEQPNSGSATARTNNSSQHPVNVRDKITDHAQRLGSDKVASSLWC
mmetsp:Transcript_18314/g.62209  ORF Transcript_18314/g.62209 Transcript_18314/m.62209 type:complete len:452 (-) Transcript_18314:1044-2399(-)